MKNTASHNHCPVSNVRRTILINGILIDLKPIETTDLPLIQSWRNNPNLNKYFFDRQFLTMTNQNNWYTNMITDPTRFYCMVAIKGGLKIGIGNLSKIDSINRNAELGVYIGNFDYHLAGFGAEAYLRLIEYGFDHLNLHKIYGNIFDFNKGVIALCKRFGFQIEGELKEHAFFDGQYHNVICVGLFKDDFYDRKQEMLNIIQIFAERRDK